MENDRGELVDLYVPRKCSATGRRKLASPFSTFGARPQITPVFKSALVYEPPSQDLAVTDLIVKVARLDENGRQIPGENHVYALSGFVRAMGESDDAFNRITQKDGLLKSVWSPNR
ncbi:hypothetical protein NUW58_g821 [Xylaria curta]|uniref:Uncharacterized protein n=1 Tax=Xylaria curta TaxID=42375 RepID=A0ACC1PQC9_9PEZI|nr:hypothetical protein NUW58_g821 [Xylaria curta]